MMINIELQPEERAVLNAIIAQRLDSEGDIFEYDYKKAREFLNGNGDSRRLFITPKDQRRIVIELASRDIIDADEIVNREFFDNLRSSINPKYVPDESAPAYFWWRNKPWARKSCQLGGLIPVKMAYELDKGALYIRMTKEEAKSLNNSYNADHVVQLAIDENRTRLGIRVDKHRDWLYSASLHEEKAPYQILCYAFKKPEMKITRDELFDKTRIDVRDRYLGSQVFSDNGTVKALSRTPLLELDKEWILLKKAAKLTTNQLDILKTVFKI